MFKVDLHVHTSEVSSCGKVTAAETVRLYKQAGFDAICITDHYSKGDIERLKKKSGYKDIVSAYYEGYYKALEEGEKIGLTVIPSMELRPIEVGNDYLIVGMTPEFLKDHTDLHTLSLKALNILLHSNDMLLIQAHPFRPNINISDYTVLDGIEVYNGHICHDSQNDTAYSYAKERGFLMTASSDCHWVEDVARGAVIFDERVKDAKDIVRKLNENNYELFTTQQGFLWQK